MKGQAAKKAQKKLKAQGKGKSSGKPNGNKRRAILRQENRSYNQQRKIRTKLKRTQTQPPGFPQGKHVKGGDCNCGTCARGYKKEVN